MRRGNRWFKKRQSGFSIVENTKSEMKSTMKIINTMLDAAEEKNSDSKT